MSDGKPLTRLSRQELIELIVLKDQELVGREERLVQSEQQLTARDRELARKQDVIGQLEEKIAGWELAYNKLWQQRFGRRSERYLNDPRQLALDFGDTDEANDAAEGLADAVEESTTLTVRRHRKSRKQRDESLPEHLPRYETTAEAPEDVKTCPEHGERSLLPESMWDRTETLEWTPPSAKVKVTKFPKFACPNRPECGISSPERPTGIIEGNKYDSSVAAEIINNKYGFHLPVYRQQDLFAGSGWNPSRSTLLNILSGAHYVLLPLLMFFKRTVQQDPIIGCDDTGVTLLYPKELPQFDLSDPKQRRMHEVFQEALENNKASINAKMWAYRGVNVKLNFFDFTVSRHRDGPEWFFENYRGTVLGDCWHGFESIAVASGGEIVRAACNAHARRKIFESQAYPADRAQWLEWFGELYDIEDRGKALSPDNRLELRQTESRAVWERMRDWLNEAPQRTKNVILPKSDLAGALRYIENHWAELTRYLDDPHLPMDNNETEQLMRQVAVGRKNWLFAGSVPGGERAAGFLTLVSSALRNDLDVWRYVKDVLDQLLSGVTDYEPLLPWNWGASHPESIRRYRQLEREDRFERKAIRRAARRRTRGAAVAAN